MTDTVPTPQPTYSIPTVVAHLGAVLDFLRSPGDSSGVVGLEKPTVMPRPAAASPTTQPHAMGNGSAQYPAGYSYGGGTPTSDWDKFYGSLLQRLNLPVTDANMAFMHAWNQAEGMSTNTNNPFATTQEAPGATSINSVGVKSYTSMEQGVEATAQTLENGLYGDILAGLQAGNDPMASAVGVANSPWGTGSLVMRVLGG